MLLRAGVISDLQLNAALAEQQRWGGRLGRILVRMGALAEDILVLALCRQLGLPKAELDGIVDLPDALKQRVDQATCERFHVLPLAYVAERRAIQLAMSDPFDVVALDHVTRLLGTRIEAFLAGDQALAVAIRRLYGAVALSPAPASAPPAPAAPPAGLAARIDEHRRGVQAVAELLAERGHVPWMFRG